MELQAYGYDYTLSTKFHNNFYMLIFVTLCQDISDL